MAISYQVVGRRRSHVAEAGRSVGANALSRGAAIPGEEVRILSSQLFEKQPIIGPQVDHQARLERTRRRLSAGSVSGPHRATGRNPTVVLSVVSRGDLLRLCDVFDRYPLRGKKHLEYTIWREAVETYATSSGLQTSGRHMASLRAVACPRVFRRLTCHNAHYRALRRRAPLANSCEPITDSSLRRSASSEPGVAV
jgi:hypothetical protein